MTDTRAAPKPTLLFVCAHNAGRSALAAALARHQAGDRATVLSAGTTPAETPSADTIASLAEIGIDDSAHVPWCCWPSRRRTGCVSGDRGRSVPPSCGAPC